MSHDAAADNEKLNQLLEQRPDSQVRPNNGKPAPPDINGAAVSAALAGFDLRQWAIGPNQVYRPCGGTEQVVPSGVYKVRANQAGLFLERAKIVTDDLIVLPDSANERVLEGMTKFWQSKERYQRYGLIYKRGILLWGPPGGGKTATLQLMMRQLVEDGGIILLCEHPDSTVGMLHILRRIEPDRNLIVVLEDLDEIIGQYGEHVLLALLDGEFQIDNCVMVGTTNYPDRLGARIVNRPSRFDERIHVDMPSAEARMVYLRKVAPTLTEAELLRWVQDTDKMSVAHLRELAAAVLCLEQEYEDVIQRLQTMRTRPREISDGFRREAVGFGGAGQAALAGGWETPTRAVSA